MVYVRSARAADPNVNPEAPFTNWEVMNGVGYLDYTVATSDVAIPETLFNIPISGAINIKEGGNKIGLCHYDSPNGVDFYWYCPDLGAPFYVIGYNLNDDKKHVYLWDGASLQYVGSGYVNVEIDLDGNRYEIPLGIVGALGAGLGVAVSWLSRIGALVIPSVIVYKYTDARQKEANVKERMVGLVEYACSRNPDSCPYVVSGMVQGASEFSPSVSRDEGIVENFKSMLGIIARVAGVLGAIFIFLRFMFIIDAIRGLFRRER